MANLKKLDDVISELEEQSDNLKDFNKIYAELTKQKEEMADILPLLSQSNDGLTEISSKIQKALDNLKVQVEMLENAIAKKIQEIYQDNKGFQKELDASLITRLDKHKSDIQLEIRNEGAHIQRTLEGILNTSVSSIESKLNENLNEQKPQFKTIKILLFVFMVIVILLGTMAYFK